MSSKKPRKGSKEETKKLSPRARIETEIAEMRAETAASDRRTQNRIEFIVEQQAQFVTDIEKLNETVARLANATLARFEESNVKHRDTDEKFAALVDAQIKTEEASKMTDEKFAALVDAQIKTEEASKTSDEKFAALVDAQIKTEEAGQKTDVKIAALADAQIKTEEAGKKTDEKIAALADAQMRTEETVKKTSEDVRNLTAVVDRYLSEKRNGN